MGRKIKNPKPTMKFFAAVAALCLFASAYTTSCTKDLYCMECKTKNTCSSCLNDPANKAGAKSLKDGNCKTALTKTVTGTKYYSGTHTNESTTWGIEDVHCGTGAVWHMNSNVSPATYTCDSSTAVAGSSGTCYVADCLYTACTTASGGAVTKYCQVCATGKVNANRTLACAATASGTAIANCSQYSGAACAVCASGYSLNSAGNACVAFSSDKNCAQVDATAKNCTHCAWGYYFSGSKCVLFAKIFAAGVALAISAFIY